MKVKLDEHIPVRLGGELAKLGHDVETVASEGRRPDRDVWSAAKREERFLITQDLDFSDVRQFKHGTHPGLLLIRLREPGANALLSRIQEVIQAEGLDSFARCFVVLTTGSCASGGRDQKPFWHPYPGSSLPASLTGKRERDRPVSGFALVGEPSRTQNTSRIAITRGFQCRAT